MVKAAKICGQTWDIAPGNNCNVNSTNLFSVFPIGPNYGYTPPHSYPWRNLFKTMSLDAYYTTGARNEHPLVHGLLLTAKKLPQKVEIYVFLERLF